MDLFVGIGQAPTRLISFMTRSYIRIQAKAESGLTREETLHGRTYLVMPVVAIVQGVLHGANSEAPEFAPASEFGKNINGWNGRPVVMNHPQDDEGNYVAANSPEVLNSWAMGWIFNAHVEDNKLKVEAWVDVARCEEMEGDFLETLERIKNDELVEVSVGVFINPVSKTGTYAGKKYSSVWSNVVPDHLAFLSNGSTGACSVKDGCGTPRLNEAKDMTVNLGGDQNPGVGAEDLAATSAQPSPHVHEGGTCTCNGGSETPAPGDDAPEVNELDVNRANEAVARAFSERLSDNTVPAGRFNNDIYKAVAAAIRKQYRGYCYGYTSDYAVYEGFDNDYNYVCMKVGIDVSDDLQVKFTSEPSEVQIVMQIIDKPEDTKLADNNATQAGGGAAPAVTSETPAPAPVTVESYINNAPAAVREVLEEGMRVQTERKDTLVKSILSTNSGAFSEDELKAMSLKQLMQLATLAKANVQAAAGPTDFTGLGAPRLVTEEENTAPTPLKMWA